MKLLRRDPDKGYLDTLLWVPKKHINVDGTKRALTFTFAADQGDITILSLWKETEHHLLLPREFWNPADLPFPILDVRPRAFATTEFHSKITLDFISPKETTQKDALSALLNARGGILQLACGKGKTVVALELAAQLRVPTLVIVDNTQLLGQWRAAILGDGTKSPLLDLRPDEVGLIQGSVFDWKKPIVIATYQTLANRALTMPEEVRRWFGLIIWDEGHHIAAPTFARSADLFYGYRLALTATPTREDGYHVIYDFHLGKIVYKDLKQELRPRIYFIWTGLELDFDNVATKLGACDKNGELHLSKLSTFFGQWVERLQFILAEVKKATDAGRKILVLSNSVDELINLLCLWSGYKQLYSNIPMPTAADVGEVVPPASLDEKQIRKIHRLLPQVRAQLRDPSLNPLKRQNLVIRKTELEYLLRQHAVAEKIETELRKRQRTFLKDLLTTLPGGNAGLMIHKVKPAERTEMLRTKQVVFAVAKYGREGLDKESLDTVLVCEPFSSRNTLQQVMGRALRPKAGKKHPVIIFLEDNIGPIIGMCQKLRKAMREWPVEENGPFEYEMLGHPAIKRRGQTWMTQNSLRAPGQ